MGIIEIKVTLRDDYGISGKGEFKGKTFGGEEFKELRVQATGRITRVGFKL